MSCRCDSVPEPHLHAGRALAAPTIVTRTYAVCAWCPDWRVEGEQAVLRGRAACHAAVKHRLMVGGAVAGRP